jgi:predicted nucleic acid-binding protein
MRVVDTSIWIETLIGSAFGRKLMDELPSEPEWLMPTIVQLEVSNWLRRERSTDVHNRVMVFSMTCQIVPLDTHIAVAAAEIAVTHKLATADAIVLATARSRSADLLTADRHFDGLADVVYRSPTG